MPAGRAGADAPAGGDAPAVPVVPAIPAAPVGDAARRAPLSASRPKSSGRRAISIMAGRTPMASVQTPRAYHAVCQLQAPMMACATRGISASPEPWEMWFTARGEGAAADKPVADGRGRAQFQRAGENGASGHIDQVKEPDLADGTQAQGAQAGDSRGNAHHDAGAIAVNQRPHYRRQGYGANPAQAYRHRYGRARPAQFRFHRHHEHRQHRHRHQRAGRAGRYSRQHQDNPSVVKRGPPPLP